MNNTTIYPTLAQIACPATSNAVLRACRTIVLLISGAAILTASAKIQIPFYPVPQTLQTMFVLLIGMAYGFRLGVCTVLLYLAAGAAGLPVFAGTPEKGIGIAYMAGPTGGYLLGFAIAAAVCGKFAQYGWDRKIWQVAVAMIIGSVIIYACGLPWLGVVIGWDKPIFKFGLLNFILGDLVKVIFAATALPMLSRAIRR